MVVDKKEPYKFGFHLDDLTDKKYNYAIDFKRIVFKKKKKSLKLYYRLFDNKEPIEFKFKTPVLKNVFPLQVVKFVNNKPVVCEKQIGKLKQYLSFTCNENEEEDKRDAFLQHLKKLDELFALEFQKRKKDWANGRPNAIFAGLVRTPPPSDGGPAFGEQISSKVNISDNPDLCVKVFDENNAMIAPQDIHKEDLVYAIIHFDSIFQNGSDWWPVLLTQQIKKYKNVKYIPSKSMF